MPLTDEIQGNFIPPLMEEGLFQTMANSIVQLTARAKEPKSRNGFENSLDKRVQKRAINGF